MYMTRILTLLEEQGSLKRVDEFLSTPGYEVRKDKNKYNIKNLFKEIINIYSNKIENKGLSFNINIEYSLPEFYMVIK